MPVRRMISARLRRVVGQKPEDAVHLGGQAFVMLCTGEQQPNALFVAVVPLRCPTCNGRLNYQPPVST